MRHATHAAPGGSLGCSPVSHATGASGSSPPAKPTRGQPCRQQNPGPYQAHVLAALSLDLKGYEDDRAEAPLGDDEGVQVQQRTAFNGFYITPMMQHRTEQNRTAQRSIAENCVQRLTLIASITQSRTERRSRAQHNTATSMLYS